MESFEAELGARFPIRLDGQHVVSADHVRAATVPWALGGERFEWTFRRSSQAQYDALAAFLVSAVDALPPASGALVFCPSYSVLGQAMKRLRDSGALARMGDGLWVGEETREQTGEALVATMRAALSRGRKALLLVPARGKVSGEGAKRAAGASADETPRYVRDGTPLLPWQRALTSATTSAAWP